MKLINPKTQETFEGQIIELSPNDYQEIKRSGQFDFDWDKEKDFLAYKLVLVNEEEILGLMSLFDIPHELRIHLNLIESARIHQGKDKQLERIPGCLIAFAARLAFNKGYNGFVSLLPKTRLIEHYVQSYGFAQYGRYLAIEAEASMNLISKFLLP